MPRFEQREFGTLSLTDDHPYLIAEAGVNHEGDLETALRMVEEAASAGADAIKFQSYKAETLASRFSPSYWDLSKEPTTSQFELFKKFDAFGAVEYKALAKKADECGIAFVSTAFDLDFVDLLADLMPVFKVASADLTNYPLIRRCAEKGKPLILSVGAASLAEVDEAVNVARSAGCHEIALLHCVLSYPTSPDDAHLRVIEHLNYAFPDCVTGYSDHVPPDHDCLALTMAWLMGARILEKHFTLDKSLEGNDHYHAMDPDDIRRFRASCGYATSMLGERMKRVLDCEEESRKQARRSLVLARDMKKGEKIGPTDVALKRPGTGIEPKYFDDVVGSALKDDTGEDVVLQWAMLE